MFRNAVVGDKVWDIIKGFGVVFYKDSDSIGVSFESEIAVKNYYQFNGKQVSKECSPRLFWRPFEIPKEAFKRPLPELAKDTKVLVCQDRDRKKKRYFSHFDSEGFIHCFENGCTSWNGTTSRRWNNWELYNESL